jgi:transporter family-2 protein
MGANELAPHPRDTEKRMTYWPYLLAIVVGAGLTLQVGMNGTIGTAIGSPLLASVANFVIGTVALGAVALASGVRVAPGSAAAVPAGAWLGGLFGAAYVAAVTVLGPRLGAVALLALVLLGQMAAALVVDHFGIVGFPEHGVTPSRLVGIVLLVAGVVLVARK